FPVKMTDEGLGVEFVPAGRHQIRLRLASQQMRWVRTDRFPIGGNPMCRWCCQSGRRAIKRFELFGEALGSKTTKIVFRWYSHLYKLPHRRCYSVVSERLSGCNRVGALFLFNYG